MFKKLYFLTFRGVTKKQQKIGYVSDMCKKISNNYFIVRECNKKTEGYHFHALLSLTKNPAQGWFKKGCHIHLQPLNSCKTALFKLGGNSVPPINGDITEQDLYENNEDPEIFAAHKNQLIEKAVTKCFKSTKNWVHVCRVVNYMKKEFEMPCQYSDYILVLRGKQAQLPSIGGPQQT